MNAKEIYRQLRSNAVTIITLIIAVTALSYNAWRQERSEANRTRRVAAFEVLKDLGELQVIVNYAYYGVEGAKNDPMLGWGYISLIGDLSQILPSPIPEKVDQLITTWKTHWGQLKTNEESANEITKQIDSTRIAIREQLESLH